MGSRTHTFMVRFELDDDVVTGALDATSYDEAERSLKEDIVSAIRGAVEEVLEDNDLSAAVEIV